MTPHHDLFFIIFPCHCSFICYVSHLPINSGEEPKRAWSNRASVWYKRACEYIDAVGYVRARAEVFRLLFCASPAFLHLREIQRRSGLALGTLRAFCGPYKTEGIISEGALTMTIQLEDALKLAASALRQLGAREIYVFGSAACGRTRDGSDVDLAVTGLEPGLFFRAMSRAADVLGRPVDLIDLDDDSPFVRYLKEEKELRRVG